MYVSKQCFMIITKQKPIETDEEKDEEKGLSAYYYRNIKS